MLKQIFTLGLVLCWSSLTWGQNPNAGKVKFDQLCATCHGASGKGDGAAAAGLNPKPKDLTQTRRTDAELKKIIQSGGPAAGLSPLMPPWGGSLTDKEIADLLAHIRSLTPKASK